MTTPTRRVGGRPWRRVVAHTLAAAIDPRHPDLGPICALCGHGGADTGDHVTPLEDGGAELDPDNVRAAHGTRRTLDADGYDCPGNYAHQHRTPPSPTPPPSRIW